MPQFDPSAFWGIAGIVVGIIVATIFFFLGRKKTLFQYAMSTTPLVTEETAKILNGRMSIDGQTIKSLSSTTISFSNSGNQRIQFSDFSTRDPLRVYIRGHLYCYEVFRVSQKIFPKIEPVGEEVLNISFENLKPRQFFMVRILHDGSLYVLGELTTGTMREYSHNSIFLRLGIVTLFISFFITVDSMYRGYVASLIGNTLTSILLTILAFLITLFFLADILKQRMERKLFMH